MSGWHAKGSAIKIHKPTQPPTTKDTAVCVAATSLLKNAAIAEGVDDAPIQIKGQ
jgi:hypothetical protein